MDITRCAARPGAAVLAALVLVTPAFADYPTADPWRVMAPAEPTAPLPGDDAPPRPCEHQDIPDPLDLRAVVELALCNNPQARQSWAAAIAQSAQIGEAMGAYLPSAIGNLSGTHDAVETKIDQPFPQRSVNNLDAFGQNLTVSFMVLDFGTRAANVRQSRRLLDAALASHDAVVQSVFATAAQTYYDCWATDAARTAAEEAEKTAQENYSAAAAKARSGAGSRVDELQAKSAAAQAVLTRVRAESAAKMAVGSLAYVLGIPARTPLHVAADPLIEGAEAIDRAAADGRFARDLDELMNAAATNNPSVRAAREQVQAAKAKRAATEREGLPSVSVNFGRYLNGRPTNPLTQGSTYETLASVNLSIPLFEGFTRNYKIIEADAAVRARSAELENTEAQTSLEAWRNYQTLLAETAAVAASKDLLAGGEEGLAAARAAYASGAIDVVELLNAQKDYANARQERIRAVAAWRAARLKVLGSLGQLGFWALNPPTVQ